MKRLAIGLSGKSGSGKTTFGLKLAEELISRGFKVCIVKHDPGDKARFDVEGKDSNRYSDLGADVGVVSPRRLSLFLKRGLFGGEDRVNSDAHYEKCENFDAKNVDLESDLRELVMHFGEFDYLIIEGLKYLPVPKIVVFRKEFDPKYLPFADAVASDLDVDFGVCKFALDDVANAIKWIDKNAKKV